MTTNNQTIYDPIYTHVDKMLRQCDRVLVIAVILLTISIPYVGLVAEKPVDYLTMQSTVRFQMEDGEIIDAHMAEIIDYYIAKDWSDALLDEGRE